MHNSLLLKIDEEPIPSVARSLWKRLKLERENCDFFHILSFFFFLKKMLILATESSLENKLPTVDTAKPNCLD